MQLGWGFFCAPAHVLGWAVHGPVPVALVLWGSKWSMDVMTSTCSLNNLGLWGVCQGRVRSAWLRRAACLLGIRLHLVHRV